MMRDNFKLDIVSVKFLYRRVPIFQNLSKYNKTCMISDFVAGITVGLTLIPQAIAYIAILELPPHYGLYTALMGSFVYMFFGTIKQVSIGPSSNLSILSFSYIRGRGYEYYVLLAFVSGCVEILMAVFNLMSRIRGILYRRLTILRHLSNYDRTCLISDFIAGVTVGLTMMPQSIAYAAILEIPAHYGLYTAFMGSFVYVLFGTIKQVSIGPSSTMSILSFSYLQGKSYEYYVLMTFVCGCVEIFMAALNLGFLIDFISAPVTSGFTSATALSITLGQLRHFFGIKIRSGGHFTLVKETVSNLKNLKISDTTMGVISITILLTIRRVSQLDFKNPKLKKAMWYLSICRNAIVILLASVVAFCYEFKTGNQPFTIVGKITPGLPPFKLPPFSVQNGNQTVELPEMLSTFGTGIIIVPIVAVLANVAIAKAFAGGAVVDATQEMMTLGIANVMGSFVGSVPTTGAFTRSAVNNASNVQTPISALYTGLIMILALSFLTPYFYFIPKASIAAVLISAVIFMIEYWEVPRLWRCNKFDLAIGLITFSASIGYSMEFGLLLGAGLNIIMLLKLWTRPRINFEHCVNSKGQKYLKVLLELGLLYPGVNHLSQEIAKISNANCGVPIILDLGRVVKIDYTACKALIEIDRVFKKKLEQVVYVNAGAEILKTLRTVEGGTQLDVSLDANCEAFGEEDELGMPLLKISKQ